MIETAIYSALSSTSAITDLCATRIYPVTIPEDATYPLIAYSIVSGVNKPTFSTRGFSKLRVSIESWGKTYSDAVTLRTAVIQALDGYRCPAFTSTFISLHDLYDRELLAFCSRADFYIFTSI